MLSKANQKIADDVLQRYQDRTPRSRKHAEMASHFLPGGDTRTATYYNPYPTYMAEGMGCTVIDVDGNSYVDFHNNYISLVHGHAFAPTLEAVRKQLGKGTIHGSPSTLMYEHAQILQSRMPSMELIRYANSGTEATMFAMRAARAFTGKYTILRMDGGYHGTHDFVEVNVAASPDDIDGPKSRMTVRGVPPTVLDHTVVVPYNDLQALEIALNANKDSLAAVIVEPMMGSAGDIPAEPGYLVGIRELTRKYNVLMIADEIITLRLSLGGAQKLYGFAADLTTVGKFVGGGFPIGAFGGRKDIMSQFDPRRPGFLTQSGTFNGNNVSMTAGIANMTHFNEDTVIQHNALGARLRKGFADAFSTVGIRGQMTGVGPMGTLHWTDGPIVNAFQAAVALRDAGQLPKLIHMAMLNRGVFIPMRSQYVVSTPMADGQVDLVIETFIDALRELKPVVAEVAPQLIK